MDGFHTIAVASTFSPRFLPLLAEAKHFAETVARDFCVIHSGQPTEENKERFSSAFAELGISPQIHWASGSPSDAIMSCVAEQKIDLLIAGALERETEGRHFLGRVARVLMRDAPCSLLFFTKPARSPKSFRTMAFVTDFSETSRASLLTVLAFARKAQVEKIHVLRIFTIFAQVLAEPHEFIDGGEPAYTALAAEEERLKQFVAELGASDLPLDARCIEGTTGFAASDFVQSIGVDLLVIPAAPPGSEEVFPARMEWLFNVIPCNLLVYRTR